MGGPHPSASSGSRKFVTRRDPTLTKSASWTMKGRYNDEVDKLASNNPFFPGGTHRAEYGQALLTDGRCFDKKKQDALRALGRQWKATPGPGAYKTQRVIGEIMPGGSCPSNDNAPITENRLYREPGWKFSKGPKCKFMEDQAGTSAFTPGPGTYKTWSHFAPPGVGNAPAPPQNRWASTGTSADVMCAPNLPRSQSVTILNKTVNDSDRLASCNPFYMSGTHRANYGETFLTNGRIRDDKTIDQLTAQGRHWKQTPGAGSYKTQLCINPNEKLLGRGEASLDRTRIYHEPAWKFGKEKQIKYDTMPGVIVDSPGPAAYDKFVEIV